MPTSEIDIFEKTTTVLQFAFGLEKPATVLEANNGNAPTTKVATNLNSCAARGAASTNKNMNSFAVELPQFAMRELFGFTLFFGTVNLVKVGKGSF